MIRQITLNTHSQKTSQANTLVGSEVKNPLPTKMNAIMEMDEAELSWFFADETFGEKFLGCGK